MKLKQKKLLIQHAHCKATFMQKLIRDRQIKGIHQRDAVTFVKNISKLIKKINSSTDNQSKSQNPI